MKMLHRFFVIAATLFFTKTFSVNFYQRSLKYPSESFHNVTVSDRYLYFNTSAPSIPCGYMLPSELDKIRLQYSKPKPYETPCSIVIVRLLFGAYEHFTTNARKYNVLKTTELAGEKICYILITDKASAESPEIGPTIFPNFPTPYNWTVHVLEELPYPNPAKTMKTIKLTLFRMFPLAKYIFYYDVKYHFYGNPVEFIKKCDEEMKSLNVSFTIMKSKYYETIRKSFNAALARLKYLNHFNVVHDLNSELADISRQIDQYTSEGFFEKVAGREDLIVDSAMLIVKNEDSAQRFFCAWVNEVILFSRRDQLSFAYLETKLNITGYKYPYHLHWRNFRNIGHAHPSSNTTMRSRKNVTNSNHTKLKSR